MNLLDKITKNEEPKKSTTVQEQPLMYTEEQLMARLRFFIGICLALTLTGIVFVVLYSIIFVTQPLNAISPIDQKFFELIIPIATFLTGTLSGIMLAGKDDKSKLPASPMTSVTPPASIPPTTSSMPVPPRPPMPAPMMAPPPMPMADAPEPPAPKLNALDLGIK
jgi:hypothetical protein